MARNRGMMSENSIEIAKELGVYDTVVREGWEAFHQGTVEIS